MSDKYTTYENKPYVFIPLVEKVDRPKSSTQDRQMIQTDSNEYGSLSITITPMTPLHFGTGQLAHNEGFFYSPLFRDGECVSLPGSSFKGMLRAVFETVSESCILISPRALPEAIPSKSTACHADDVCPACSVFGCLGRKGKLQFSPFKTQGAPATEILKIPALNTPFRDYPRNGFNSVRRGQGNERLYYGNFPDLSGVDVGDLSKEEFFQRKNIKREGRPKRFYGRKFYRHSKRYNEVLGNGDRFECLMPEPGSTLTGTITYKGLTKPELSILLFALGVGWEKPIYHKIGYAKPAFLGSVRLQIEHAIPPTRYSWPHYSTDELEAMAREHYQSSDPQVKKAATALMNVWGVDGWDDSDKKQLYWHSETGGRHLIY